MNFQLRDGYSVILMSRRSGAPYVDSIQEDGRILIYEGHDVPRGVVNSHPKQVDQPDRTPGGRMTQNGLFAKAAGEFKAGTRSPELVRVYEKIHAGIWVYNGLFRLVDCWKEQSGPRKVFKFKLEIVDSAASGQSATQSPPAEDRVIPSWVKLEVWKRDKGQCTKCGSNTDLHFDHVIPYSKGGSSRDPRNIQILCGHHNLAKSDQIE
jgi:hypothetical protein